MPAQVEIVEVSPRDGLQNEARIVSTADKSALIAQALEAGARRIEVASFVDPGKVPQMADAEAVVAALPETDAVYIGLVLNRRGAMRALATRVDQLGAVCIATDSFAMRNQGQTGEGSLEVACEVVGIARDAGRSAQITIGAAFGCPFEGEVPHDRVVAMARRAAASGAIEVALADTIGVAVPAQVAALVARVRAAIAPLPVRVHLHNTRNTGLANVWAAVEAGAATIDASLGGLGGCPFAPGASGNVPTEDVVYLLERSGVGTGLDLDRLIAAAGWLAGVMGRSLPGMVSKAQRFPPAPARILERAGQA
ncbi:hydroxymethylglutaryl-CoA lyase [Sphingomonas bacterium]|uniref:hydroxymethylglutaryl-CoA lyase n=1 Tax=Sphingomonas bacterium TaxID=1895847 RepID=UPI0015755ACC|nr:hydroxymethylglutaryl-CoA lyase [Sphingomonas bacterium]